MTRIIEINKMLFYAQKHAGRLGIPHHTLLREIRRVRLTEESSNYQTVLDTCRFLNLVTVIKQNVNITNDGIQYLKHMTRDGSKAVLDPNTTQKNFLLGLVEKQAITNSRMQRFFDKFQIDFSQPDKKWFALQKITELPDDLVVEIGLVESYGNRLEVNKSKSTLVSKIKNRSYVTEDDIVRNLDKQRRVGSDAEKYTVDYEKKRLISASFPDMALGVQKISDVDPYAGYDILSFNGGGQSYVHNRRIEVKGTSTNINRFYWSRNEINVARKYGNEYWIYFWKNVGKSNYQVPKMIHNPYRRFFTQNEGKKEPVSYELQW